MEKDEIRWELGERVWRGPGWYKPMGFILVHAAVLAAMHLKRAIWRPKPKPPVRQLVQLGRSRVAAEVQRKPGRQARG